MTRKAMKNAHEDAMSMRVMVRGKSITGAAGEGRFDGLTAQWVGCLMAGRLG